MQIATFLKLRAAMNLDVLSSEPHLKLDDFLSERRNLIWSDNLYDNVYNK